MKKQGKIIAIVLVLLAFVVFFMIRPVREKACPLTKAATTAAVQEECTRQGGVLKDGNCTCPE